MNFGKRTDVKKAQEVLLGLLVIIDRVCRENDIEYWVDGGTLLGATRNEKFIPWDDDLDVCLLPEDHDRLIKILKEDIVPKNSKVFLYSSYRPFPHWSEYLADFTLLKSGNLPYKVDILKIKSIPNTKESIAFDKSMINLASFFGRTKFKSRELVFDDHYKQFVKSGFFMTRRKRLIKFFNKYANEMNKKDTSNLYNYPYNDIYVEKERGYYSYEDIFPLREINFEGMSIKAPNNIDSYLTRLYGKDYLQPPPKEYQKPASSKFIINKAPILLVKINIFVNFLLKEILNSIRLFILKKL